MGQKEPLYEFLNPEIKEIAHSMTGTRLRKRKPEERN